jgi:hypothetical protein
MSEDSEEACLVRSPSQQQGSNFVGGGTGTSHTMPYGTQGHQATMNSGGGSSGRGSQSHESESGELIDYSDEVLLSQFHADAIKQVIVTKEDQFSQFLTLWHSFPGRFREIPIDRSYSYGPRTFGSCHPSVCNFLHFAIS